MNFSLFSALKEILIIISADISWRRYRSRGHRFKRLQTTRCSDIADALRFRWTESTWAARPEQKDRCSTCSVGRARWSRSLYHQGQRLSGPVAHSSSRSRPGLAMGGSDTATGRVRLSGGSCEWGKQKPETCCCIDDQDHFLCSSKDKQSSSQRH